MFSEFKSFENENSFQEMKTKNENTNQTHPKVLNEKGLILYFHQECGILC